MRFFIRQSVFFREGLEKGLFFGLAEKLTRISRTAVSLVLRNRPISFFSNFAQIGFFLAIVIFLGFFF